ncbi:recombinase RecT [Coralloluteibacterium thermophilus]|uniref:Recombinase RecT n=1 Tax=Coralloluteibacterium thermophilum TaxID=2707049 RepID=A0ABV9NKE3_9GAMM
MTQIAIYEEAIGAAQKEFVRIANGALDYSAEQIFAIQALTKNEFATRVAKQNPVSVELAMLNVAGTGLTLNPAHGYAYLVPRDGAIVLDISYRGLIKIATDTGSIMWARAELVYAEDEFAYNGPAAMPTHRCNPFSKERGELVGAYCVAKTHEGDFLVETMPAAEIYKIRGKSMSYSKGKSSPWTEWFEEMVRKTVIKRASKTWPHTERMGRMLDAIELANKAEGDYDLSGAATETISDAQQATIIDELDAAGKDREALLRWLKVETLADIPAKRYDEVIAAIRRAAA